MLDSDHLFEGAINPSNCYPALGLAIAYHALFMPTTQLADRLHLKSLFYNILQHIICPFLKEHQASAQRIV